MSICTSYAFSAGRDLHIYKPSGACMTLTMPINSNTLPSIRDAVLRENPSTKSDRFRYMIGTQELTDSNAVDLLKNAPDPITITAVFYLPHPGYKLWMRAIFNIDDISVGKAQKVNMVMSGRNDNTYKIVLPLNGPAVFEDLTFTQQILRIYCGENPVTEEDLKRMCTDFTDFLERLFVSGFIEPVLQEPYREEEGRKVEDPILVDPGRSERAIESIVEKMQQLCPDTEVGPVMTKALTVLARQRCLDISQLENIMPQFLTMMQQPETRLDPHGFRPVGGYVATIREGRFKMTNGQGDVVDLGRKVGKTVLQLSVRHQP